MFKLADPNDTYTWRVAVPMPGQDGRDPVQSFNARFRLLPTSEFQALFRADNLAQASDHEVIGRFLAGWDGIQTHDGADLIYSDEALGELSDIHYWARAVVEAYIEFHTGAHSKNSRTPPATG